MKGIKGKTAIVTGSRRGIGKAIALKLAKEGANVVITDIDREDCEKVTKEIKGECLALKLDVTKDKEWEEVVKKTKEKFSSVDILVNNAGIAGIEEIGEKEKIDKTLEVDLKGALLGIKNVLPGMIDQKFGRIVNISSIAALVSWQKIPTYSAAKGGLIGLTKCYAGYLGQHGININSIAPGAVETKMLDSMLKELGMTRDQVIQMTPKGRIGKPEDIANLVAFLVSEESDFITGQIIPVDGGYTTL